MRQSRSSELKAASGLLFTRLEQKLSLASLKTPALAQLFLAKMAAAKKVYLVSEREEKLPNFELNLKGY